MRQRWNRYILGEYALPVGARRIFAAAGADKISHGLRRIAATLPMHNGGDLTSVNELITRRVGYDYDAIARLVEMQLGEGH